MDNSEQFLIITILNNNKNDKIQLNEVENIEKIKEICKQKLRFENIDINKINLCFIDEDKDKSIINEINDLIKYSKINNGNLSIELIVEISGEKDNIMNNQNKENNDKYINSNNKESNEFNYDDKDRMINELNAEIEKLIMKCKNYKDQLKELIDKYEKKIRDSNKVDSKKPHENNINNDKSDIKKKEKNILCRQELQFINNICNKCGKQSDNNIYQCVKCENYYLCQVCFRENNKTNNKIHEHKYYFEIKFPDKLMEKIKLKEKHDKEYYEAVGKFNDFLNDIFFDKNGNFSKQQYIVNTIGIANFKILCMEMKKFKEDPLKYFEEYKKETINPKFESLKKEGKHEKMVILIEEKLNLISNNLFKYIPTKEAKVNNALKFNFFNYHI